MTFLIWWREIVIAALIIMCLWLFNSNQNARYEAKETQLIHEKLIAESERRNAEAVAKAQHQRQIDAEKYASEINLINSKYADLMRSNDRMRTEVKTYSDRLHTVSREAVENYAKTGALLYSECREEYTKMGQYASELDAELDKVTRND